MGTGVRVLAEIVRPAGAPNFSQIVPTGVEIDSHWGVITTDADASTITFDLSVSDWHVVVLGGNRTRSLYRRDTDYITDTLITPTRAGAIRLFCFVVGHDIK